MKKFFDIINDTINQEELSHVFGGVSADAQQTERACDTHACTKRIGSVTSLCTYGDGVCRYHAA